MTMPMDLVLVRHGESEGNVAVKASKKMGDNRHYTPEFLERHSSLWRLSDKGIRDATAAGVWLRSEMPRFDRHYTSEYMRALETAALLGLEGAEWYRELYLRERDRGWLDVVPYSVLKERFAEELERWDRSSLFWAPPGGESMADVCMRVDRVLNTLHRECEGKRVVIVCHGEVIWAFRMRLERMPQERWLELDTSKDEMDKIYNGQIVHYSRCDPLTGEVSPHLDWLRMIRANDPNFPRDWRRIVRPRFSNEQLLDVVNATKRLVSG